MLEMWIKEETSATRASIMEKWSRLHGLDQHQAMVKYMNIIKEWPGYGSTLFDVEVSIVDKILEYVGVLLNAQKRPKVP